MLLLVLVLVLVLLLLYIYIYMCVRVYIYPPIGRVDRVFTNGPGDQGSISGLHTNDSKNGTYRSKNTTKIFTCIKRS